MCSQLYNFRVAEFVQDGTRLRDMALNGTWLTSIGVVMVDGSHEKKIRYLYMEWRWLGGWYSLGIWLSVGGGIPKVLLELKCLIRLWNFGEVNQPSALMCNYSEQIDHKTFLTAVDHWDWPSFLRLRSLAAGLRSLPWDPILNRIRGLRDLSWFHVIPIL